MLKYLLYLLPGGAGSTQLGLKRTFYRHIIGDGSDGSLRNSPVLLYLSPIVDTAWPPLAKTSIPLHLFQFQPFSQISHKIPV